ncbi:MAG: beta-ketoacyl-ACP synthase II [Chitinivibrionales bacterium]|nr:beta-ketoacyl-ACP synthase II [Chitinivibrionales bacterium]
MSRRVVITGMGAVTPIGNDVDTYWQSLLSGTSGIAGITAFDVTDYACRIAAEVKDFKCSDLVDPKEARRTDRVILFAITAAEQAAEQAGLQGSDIDPDRVGVIIGSGIGGIRTLEDEHTKLVQRGPGRVGPFLIPMMISDMSSGLVSIKLGLKGPNYSVVSACASGANAIGDAWLGIKAGIMDAAVAGGAEATISPISLAGFCSMKALSTRNDTPEKASCPFDRKRDGFVMGEGAGIFVLEELEHARKRGATILGEVIGYGATGDAHHLSAPAPAGEGAIRAMKMALSSAGLQPPDIDYMNAHGTSTQLNDKYESAAIGSVFGECAEKLSISSTKSMTGHLLGASGAIELIASVLAIRDGVIPPTINYEDPDPDCPLNYTPNEPVRRQVTYAQSNSFGFGGHNASLIIGKYDGAEGGS